VSRNFPHLGFDPTPGDVELSRSFARQVSNLANELGAMQVELTTIDLAGWTGKAAIAFRDHLGQEITPLIRKAHQSFDNAAMSLNRWTNQLQGFQAEADALEREAAAKQGALDSANHALNASSPSSSAGGSPNPSSSGTDHQDLQKQQKQQAVTDAGNALNSVRHRAHELHDRYITAAGVVARSLDNAGHIAPPEPGLFDDIVNGVAGAWDATCDWVKKHADLIKAIADFLSDIGAALQIAAIVLAPIEPLGAFLEGLSLAANGLALVGDLVAKAGGANVSWLSIGLAAFGVVPGIGVLGKGTKVAEDGVEAGTRAAELGKAYKVGDKIKPGASEVRNWVGSAKKVEGGVKFKGVALFGKKQAQMMTAKGVKGRLAMLNEKNIVGGQTWGSGGAKKALGSMQSILHGSVVTKVVGDGKVLHTLNNLGDKAGALGNKIDTTSNLAHSIDSNIATAKLVHTVNGQTPEFHKEFGARFHKLASAF